MDICLTKSKKGDGTIWHLGQFDTDHARRTIWHLGQFDTIIRKKIDSQILFILESFEVKNDQDDILGQKLS